ncbi:hypothetical protein VTK73DRAFT_9217 [Phialemonium thermophilum]|uniref:Bul1 C-terminal domain-containing protein n=1 Tax=Phialemonium thermophilum TaxID=223376 RepID=A0ABR3W3T5_9PEZI
MSSCSSSGMGDLASCTTGMGFPKSVIQVRLDNHYAARIYTTSSPVSGEVTIATRRDTPFDSIQILLVGNSKTTVEGVNGCHQVTHTFLKVPMPVPESSYPDPRVLEAGRIYTVPFHFVIPQYLTMNACNHAVRSDLVRDHHVLLPPSMHEWERDDLAPRMAQVEYVICARVFRRAEAEGKNTKLLEATQRIRVLPASAEEPPVSVTKHDRLYTLSKSKTLRKGLFSGKLGRVTAVGTQPPPVIVHPDGFGPITATGTTARVELAFDPAVIDILPPSVSAISGKIVAHTFYSGGPIANLPNVGDWSREATIDKRGSYAASVSLPGLSAGKVRWKQQLSAAVRRDSGYSSQSNEGDETAFSDVESPEERTKQRRSSHEKTGSKAKHRQRADSGGSPIYHVATLDIPIDLPLDKKTFIPTFHSCIASRVYVLQLALTLGTGSASTTLNLSLPIQVMVGSADQGLDAELPSFETAVEESEADAHLLPRVIQVPHQEYTLTSSLPGYGDSAPWR